MSRRCPADDHERPQQALAREPGFLGDAQRRSVARLDPELDPLHPELGERVLAQQRERPLPDAAPAGLGGDPVPGRAAPVHRVDVVQADRADQPPARRVDDQVARSVPVSRPERDTRSQWRASDSP